MAGTTALHTSRPKDSTSSARPSRAPKPTGRDAFEKKLTSAKKKHATVLKPIVNESVKKASTKIAKGSAQVTDGDNPTNTKSAANAPAPVESAKSPPSVKTKHGIKVVVNGAIDPGKSGAVAVRTQVVPIKTPAGDSRQPPDSKPKVPAAHGSSSGLAAVNPTAPAGLSQTIANVANAAHAADQLRMQQSAGSTNVGTDNSTSAQNVQEQLGALPTFVVHAVDGQPNGSNKDRANQGSSENAPASGDPAGTASLAAATGSSAVAINDAGNAVNPVEASTGHTISALASPLEVSGQSAPMPTSPFSTQQIKAAASAPATTQASFVEDNHPKIVSGISGQLLPNGGTMQLRLEPPGLGALHVTVHLRDGTMTAEFETSNDDATRLLSHSLGQLKSTLEATGMSVEKLHVQQAPKNDGQAQSENNSHAAPQEQQQQAQREKQRRELMQRMWRKLSGGDPLDMVA